MWNFELGRREEGNLAIPAIIAILATVATVAIIAIVAVIDYAKII